MVHLLLALIYLAFISLGLPDSLLGSAWPAIYPEISVPVSWSGLIFLLISAGTVAASLLSDRLSRRLGTGRLTLLSVFLTVFALYGFSVSRSFALLCLFAIPYGLGAGGVDTALNNYVALHYASRHMSWLHCMWGVGASLGPLVMGAALTRGLGWNSGYRTVALMQTAVFLVLLLSQPLWRKMEQNEAFEAEDAESAPPLPLREIVALPGVRSAMVCFFCYCALEQTVGLWASSYLVLVKGVDAATAARFAALFFLGVTAGRALSGFLTLRFGDDEMVRLGQAVCLLGLLLMLLPLGRFLALAGLIVIGLGCAPVFPSLVHASPRHFGARYSHAAIGVQMASAYVGTSLMPPVFGLLGRGISFRLLPYDLLLMLLLMAATHRALCKSTKNSE